MSFRDGESTGQKDIEFSGVTGRRLLRREEEEKQIKNTNSAERARKIEREAGK